MEDNDFIDTLGPSVKSSRWAALIHAIAKHLPKIDSKDYSDLLWSSTAYPMGDTQYLVDQIRELAAKTDGSLRQCQAYADMETTKAMLDLIES